MIYTSADMMTLTSFPTHIYVFAAILGVLLLSFVLFYLLPSIVVSRHLSLVIKKLRLLNGTPDNSLPQIFKNSGVLENLWQEYQSSLHKQTDNGKLLRLRSTLPAGVIFRPEVLVDIPLRADFFKHLPGLFTGVGIIGTFYGLLIGMKSFVVSENSNVVRASLNSLLHGVSEAFLISALAITLAMIITFIEKLVITGLNAKVEHLVQLMDRLFEGCVGEDYMARLVKAAETTSGEAGGSRTDDLKLILSELAEKQISATHASSIALGDRLTASIEESLTAPLAQISDALQQSHNEQDSAMPNMLKSVLEDFSRQMKDLFGGQITGINQLQQQTIEALQAAVVTLERMAGNIESAGQHSTDAMAEQLTQSISAAESRQSIMNEKLGEFVAQLRLSAERTQGDAQESLQSTLSDLSDRMGMVIDGLSAQVSAASDVSRQHQQSMAIQNENISSQFATQITAVVEGVNLAVAEMKSVVMAMRNTSNDAMSKLNNGADTLYLAARDFAKAGQGVTTTLDKSTELAGQLSQAAGSVSAASKGLSSMLGDYQSSRDAMLEQASALQSLAEQIRKDASMSGDVISRIESATQKLVAAQQDADKYLSKVSDVIGVAHQSFSEGMTRSVGEANREFHQALSDSVKLLREGIQELESTLDTAASL